MTHPDAAQTSLIEAIWGPELGAVTDDRLAVVDLTSNQKRRWTRSHLYIRYWELLVPWPRPGGLLLADNVLYGGEVVDEHATGNAGAIRAFNDRVRSDDRVESVMLPIADD